MKKFLTFLLIMFLVLPVKAECTFERFYGPYGDVSEEYPNTSEDFIYTDYNTSFDIPEEKNGREVEKIILYKYKRIKNINHISIKNCDMDVDISSLEFIYKGEIIDYTYKNTVSDDGINHLSMNKTIDIYFDNPIDQTLLQMHMIKDRERSFFNIKTGYDDVDYSFYSSIASNDFWFDGVRDTLVYNSSDIWIEDYYDNKRENGQIIKYLSTIDAYRYRDKLYRTYRDDEICNNIEICEEGEYISDYQENMNKVLRKSDQNNEIEIIISVPNTGI